MADISADQSAALINALPTGGTPPTTPLQIWAADRHDVAVVGLQTITGGTTDLSAAFNTGLN